MTSKTEEPNEFVLNGVMQALTHSPRGDTYCFDVRMIGRDGRVVTLTKNEEPPEDFRLHEIRVRFFDDERPENNDLGQDLLDYYIGRI